MSDINELQAEIVRLTVDRDNWRNQAQTELRELSAAQARVKDMERDLAAMTNATNLAIEQRDKGALSLGQENCDAEYEALREERDEAKADLARMEEYLRNSGRNMDEAQEQIAERDANLTNLRARVAELEENAQKFPWELAGKAKRLEQRNAELEKQNELLICDRARFPDKSCEVGNIIAAHIENLKSTSESNAEAWRWACVREKALKERNVELAGALRGAREELYSLREFVIDRNVTDETSDGIQDADAALAKADAALARHAAGEPAKHPDTVTEEGLTGIKFRDAKSEREVMLITEGEWRDWIACKRPDGLWVSMRVATEQDRAAIDAARKEVQP